MQVLVLNAGSSSLKFALYSDPLKEIVRGAVANLGPDARLELRRGENRMERPVAAGDHGAAVRVVHQHIGADWERDGVIVHRIVHGGPDFSAPTMLDASVLARLEELETLAPLHLPAARSVIDAAREAFGPDAASIGVFDTALFRALPPAAREYAIPEAWRSRYGVRRYGFHGFAHECLRDAGLQYSTAAAEPLRIVTVQLGRGCSVAAFRGERPIATSMGFSPLEGLVMPTRSGSVDVAAALYLMMEHGLRPDALLRMLNEQSGLLGLSGVSADPAELLRRASQGDSASALALDVFFHALHQYIGAYAGLLGGLDVIALGGGLSEHVPEMRRRTLQGAEWLGCELDDAEEIDPALATVVLSRPSTGVVALLVRVDEERVMAEHALRRVRGQGDPR